MSVLFALAAAIGWGSSDFAAGHASRRSSAVSVVILTHFAAVVALIVVSLVPGQGGSPTITDLGWGLAAGLGGGFGAMLLFRGLGKGSMAVVAPITATGAASIPVFAGVIQGDPITLLGVLGVLLALIAIVMVSLSGDDDTATDLVDDISLEVEPQWVAPPDRWAPPQGRPVSTKSPWPDAYFAFSTAVLERPTPLEAPAPAGVSATAEPTRPRSMFARPGVLDALLSGIGFGLFFVFIARTAESAGHWPLVSARGISVVMFVTGALLTRGAVLPEKGSRKAVVLAGCLDAAAALFFVLSTREGLLSVGAVLASLYPAVTIVLARFISKERIVKRQLVGLALAAAAVSLLAI